ncbi:MAG: two-component system, NarL family, sensor histidine kinase DesK [Mucilaginibacter sp.]|nr:two-component system, NarL family, sensor histidine kinase DesK [Mucilaginibacter sp.]
MTSVSSDGEADARPGIRERLTAHGARQWYLGAASGLLWQTLLVVSVIIGRAPVLSKVLGLALLAVLYAVFMVLGPLIARERTSVRVAIIAAYWAVSFALFPLIGSQTIWLWLLVVATLAFTGLSLRLAGLSSLVVVLLQFGIAALAHFELGTIFAPIVTAVAAITLIGLGALTRSSADLRLAHHEIARLAVIEERARFGRDLHDVLGHSLTVVAVKSDLARRLVRIDPDGAEVELADIEKIARSALSDLRLAVSNYREISLDSELAAANTALSAAGIDAHFPPTVDQIDPGLRSVFAWVLREGVTNVIRHSDADTCWVTAGTDHLTVADNGHGPRGNTAAERTDHGNGLRGLRERTSEVGAELVIGRSSGHGGFELTARRAS